MTRKNVLLGVAASGVAAIALVRLLAASDAADGAAADAAVALPVHVQSVRGADRYAVREIHAGRVESRRESALGFELGGRLEEVRVDRGDAVEAGEVLARLDTRALEARERELAARVAQMRARLDLARNTERRRRELRKSDHASIEALDQAETEAAALAAEDAAARAALEQVRVSLEKSELLAPYAGQITERRADEGTVVAAGAPILELVETGALEARIGVPAESAGALGVGSRHVVEVNGARHPAEIVAVIAKLEPATRTVPVVLRLVGDAPGVRAGDLARLGLEREVDGAGTWLPLTALAESRRGLWSAYVVVDGGDGTDVVERRELEVLHTESDRAFVRGTVSEGDRVVTTGLHRLVPGQVVQVLPTGSSIARSDFLAADDAVGR